MYFINVYSISLISIIYLFYTNGILLLYEELKSFFMVQNISTDSILLS